jgi:hypothetical protein
MANCINLFVICCVAAIAMAVVCGGSVGTTAADDSGEARAEISQEIATLRFEQLDTVGIDLSARLLRAKVPGGWLVVVESGSVRKEQFVRDACFVPDASHGWSVEKRADQ